MRTAPGWHGYWLNPGDAGLPMDVQWQLPKGLAVGALRYPVPTRLEIANLMNYVYEQDYAVLVRLQVPADRQRHAPDPGPCALARLHRQGLRSRARRPLARSAGRAAALPTARSSTHGARRSRSRSPASAISRPPETSSASPSRFRRASPSTSPICSRSSTAPVDYDAKQSFRRSGDLLIAELQRKGAAPKDFAGVIALGTGRGLEFRARAGAGPQRGRPDRRSRRCCRALGGAGRNRSAASCST